MEVTMDDGCSNTILNIGKNLLFYSIPKLTKNNNILMNHNTADEMATMDADTTTDDNKINVYISQGKKQFVDVYLYRPQWRQVVTLQEEETIVLNKDVLESVKYLKIEKTLRSVLNILDFSNLITLKCNNKFIKINLIGKIITLRHLKIYDCAIDNLYENASIDYDLLHNYDDSYSSCSYGEETNTTSTDPSDNAYLAIASDCDFFDFNKSNNENKQNMLPTNDLSVVGDFQSLQSCYLLLDRPIRPPSILECPSLKILITNWTIYENIPPIPGLRYLGFQGINFLNQLADNDYQQKQITGFGITFQQPFIVQLDKITSNLKNIPIYLICTNIQNNKKTSARIIQKSNLLKYIERNKPKTIVFYNFYLPHSYLLSIYETAIKHEYEINIILTKSHIYNVKVDELIPKLIFVKKEKLIDIHFNWVIFS
ncbi:hypothetical protein SGHV021 [Glossina pallidipes salivary gland hypertrophy virus]|uniref:Uncharacterized protein n=1 Tax=Glossina hytrovirus (isolate Glossina pallidipes/Ethiopia/Seibersdorf/-) TaxID=379529 RepID=B0YLH5_GHVS|nr:hypothetical protein SGHV021 [Glossina pallidipes salivary gland hypertrophy virus]ABQ08794.1 hypothetical protein SGHV021 [Glossina pallidipes salivary gland hypertrophy virus]